MIVKNIKTQFDENMNQELVITLAERVEIQPFKDILEKNKCLHLEIKEKRARRSLDANAYCWVLCQKIAEKIGSTKELVYQEIIKRVGQFEILPIKDEAVERWIRNWQEKGLGWISEVLGESKLRGYKNVISYFGSSVYDTKEMSILLNEIVEECKTLGIETLSENELQSLKSSWKTES